MDFFKTTDKSSFCPSSTPYLCGRNSKNMGLCAKTKEECDIRSSDQKPIPMPKEKNTRGIKFGYDTSYLGNNCYFTFESLKPDIDRTYKSFDKIPETFSLLTYNIFGLDVKPELKQLFQFRQRLLEQTITQQGADLLCFQEMSKSAYKHLESFLYKYKFTSGPPLHGIKSRDVDTFFVSKYRPRRVRIYGIPGVLHYKNSLMIIEYENLVVFNLYNQAGSILSLGQDSAWIHYSRCRQDTLEAVHDIIHKEFKNIPVIVCGDFNFHLDGRSEKWPELRIMNTFKESGFKDTFRSLHAKDAGLTEDTDINVMRWNMKFLPKKFRYDGIFYKGDTWKPVYSRVFGKDLAYLDKDASEWFAKVFSETTLTDPILRGKFKGQLAINASDHFGVITRFKGVVGKYTRRKNKI
jgi:exonuclease III